ncbi:MAG: FecR domain-containing protein [Bacteroidetes bacterium]|nr:FecR domain-containing protein [Bacteroidota bacterium]
MSIHNRKIVSEITRYITGDCTPDDRRVISGLIDTDPLYQQEYKELNQVWNHTGIKSIPVFDVNVAWSSVEERISKAPSRRIHRIQPVHNQVRKIAGYALRIAAVLLIGIAIFQFLVPHTSFKTIASGTSVAAPLSLADGSTIFLNSSSSIKFPEKFGGNKREVYFWGEAFFEIAHDPTRPFIIETGETRIKVLGTSFNVKAYPKTNRIEVVVNSGKVLFYHVDKNDHILGQVILLKGDKGVYFRNTGQITRLLNDEPNYLSWKTGLLVFSETSLDKVLTAVGQKYGVTFNMADKDLSQLKLTATFDNETLDAVLEVLQLVHNLQFVNNGNDYLVKKK